MNADQFDEFYGASAARLVGQLAAMLGSVVEAQDCVQEAFVKAWLHRHSFDSERNPEAWIRQRPGAPASAGSGRRSLCCAPTSDAAPTPVWRPQATIIWS